MRDQPQPLTLRHRIHRAVGDISFIAGMAAALIILGPIYLVAAAVRQFRGVPAITRSGSPAGALSD